MTGWLDRNYERVRRRWLHARNNRQLVQLAAQVQRNAPPPQEGTRPVLFFNASTRLDAISLNAAFSRIASWTVQLAGVPTAHLVCQAGMTRCVLGSDRLRPQQDPPCAVCMRQSRALYAHSCTLPMPFVADERLNLVLQGLSLAELPNFVYDGLPLGALTLPALRWMLRRNTLEQDERTLFFYRQFIASAWNVARRVRAALDELNPQALVVFNGQFYPEATARWLAQQRGLPVFTHEVGLQPFTAYFTAGEATAYPIDIPADFELSTEQAARLDAYLEQRFQGNFTMAGIRFWSEMRGLDETFWQRVRPYKQIVPIFTNVIFDTSQSHANVVFSDMFAWLDAILGLIRAHPETFFVLRAHPDECRPGKQSAESVADWVRRNRVTELPNVLFVDAHEPFSSYALIRSAKFVMIYNSTIGLEASILGAAVLCGGKARFTQLPTVFFPQTVSQYLGMAERFLTEATIAVPPEFARNARRFLYYQLFRTSLPLGDYLEEDGIWRGFVRFRTRRWQDFSPSSAPVLRTIADGILHGGDFLLPETDRPQE